MASKVLKQVKEQNKELKKAMKSQKADERAAKQAYAAAVAERGLIGTKEQRQAAKQAKLDYKREKAETKYGKELQSQGRDVQGMVSSDSRSMGVFHSDKKLSAATKQNASTYTSSAASFVVKNGVSGTKSRVTDAVGSVVDKTAKATTARALPDISQTVEDAVKNGLGLGE